MLNEKVAAELGRGAEQAHGPRMGTSSIPPGTVYGAMEVLQKIWIHSVSLLRFVISFQYFVVK